jgi:hypothetical protein
LAILPKLLVSANFAVARFRNQKIEQKKSDPRTLAIPRGIGRTGVRSGDILHSTQRAIFKECNTGQLRGKLL